MDGHPSLTSCGLRSRRSGCRTESVMNLFEVELMSVDESTQTVSHCNLRRRIGVCRPGSGPDQWPVAATVAMMFNALYSLVRVAQKPVSRVIFDPCTSNQAAKMVGVLAMKNMNEQKAAKGAWLSLRRGICSPPSTFRPARNKNVPRCVLSPNRSSTYSNNGANDCKVHYTVSVLCSLICNAVETLSHCTPMI